MHYAELVILCTPQQMLYFQLRKHQETLVAELRPIKTRRGGGG